MVLHYLETQAYVYWYMYMYVYNIYALSALT